MGLLVFQIHPSPEDNGSVDPSTVKVKCQQLLTVLKVFPPTFFLKCVSGGRGGEGLATLKMETNFSALCSKEKP